MLYFGWRKYAIASIYGGTLGIIFGFLALMIYATCIGELLILKKEYSKKEKAKFLIIYIMIFYKIIEYLTSNFFHLTTF